MRRLSFSLSVLGLLIITSIAAADFPTVQLTSGPGLDYWVTWSGDGQYVIFDSYRSGSWQIWRVPAAGGAAEQLTFGSSHREPEVSPDGSLIAFVGSNGSIYTMPVGGGSETRVSFPGASGQTDWDPNWAPDQSKIYYSRRLDPDTYKLYSVPLSGGIGSLYYNGGDLALPKVDPSGLRIAYMRDLYELVETDIATPANERVLASGPATGPLDYSPDGTRLLYGTRNVSPGLGDFFEVDVTNLQHRRMTFLADSPIGDAGYAAYSPDGTRIAYTASNSSPAEFDVYVLTLGGEPPAELELVVGDGRGLPGGGSLNVPVSLRNPTSARGLEIKITDLPEDLTVTGVELVGRAQNMTASFTDDGDLHLLIYNLQGGSIAAGVGKILNLQVSLDPEVAEDDTIELTVDLALLSNNAGETEDIPAVDGRFVVGRRPGDITGDNLVDAGDVVRLIEIILGTGDPPTEDELSAADCNEDATINIGDVTCVVDLIEESGEEAVGTVAPLASLSNMEILGGVELRGFQFTLPSGIPVQGTSDLSPWSLHVNQQGPRQFVMAFDAQGGGRAGRFQPFEIPAAAGGMVSNLRAFGPGGAPLTVEVAGNTLRIGAQPATVFRMLPNAPNPFHAATSIRFRTDRAGEARVAIFDLGGARVGELPAQHVEAGEHSWEWKALDTKGRALAAGVYIATVEVAGSRSSIRLTYLGR